mgnify:FL=1
MNDQDFERVMAYFDQELEPGQQAEVEKLLAEDVEARSFLAQLRESDDFIAGGLDSVLHEPVPQRLIDAARGRSSAANEPMGEIAGLAPKYDDSKVVEFPKKPLFSRWAWATAASITLLVAASAFIMSPGGSPTGALATALSKGLEQTLSGQVYEQVDGAIQVMPVATFRTAEAGVCRQFAAQIDDQQTVGLACRSGDGQWQIRSQQTLVGGETGKTYAPASGTIGSVGEKLRELESGQPLSADEELELIVDQWQ